MSKTFSNKDCYIFAYTYVALVSLLYVSTSMYYKTGLEAFSWCSALCILVICYISFLIQMAVLDKESFNDI